MANIDLRKGGTAALSNLSGGNCFVLEQEIDFSVNNAGAADIVQAINIPAGVHVQRVYADVTTAEGATQTFDIGTFTTAAVAIDADGFHDGVNGNAVADTDSAIGAVEATLQNGYYFASSGYLGVTAVNAADTCVMTVRAVCTKVK